MFKNFTKKSILIVTSICVMLTTTINIYVSYKQTESIEHLVIEQNNEVLPHAISFLNLKISVIQVQHWLTYI
ncbi:MAG: hypothetical protein IE909_05290 [Campylobacterales bacterium]|nr:hypothetical protein [Campylobacterales bacterium]